MNGKQVVWTAPGEVCVQENEVKSPAAGQVLVRSNYTLISPGTERAFLLEMPNTSTKFPTTYGYNNVGKVVEVGDGVDGLKAGDMVANSGPHCEYVTLSPDRMVKIEGDIDLRHASVFNMVAIALQGVRKAKIELGESVFVIGQGMIGNLAMQLSRLSGGLPVGVSDTDESRLSLARRCGADFLLDARAEDLEEQLQELTSGGPNVVIESTGHPDPVNTALQCAGWLGRVVLLASSRGETSKVNFYRDVHKKGISVIGAHNGTRPRHDNQPGYWTWAQDAKVALALIANKRLEIEPLISHEFPAEEAPKAYDLLVKWLPEFTGGLLKWTDD